MTDQKSSFAIKFIKRENVLMEAFIHSPCTYGKLQVCAQQRCVMNML